ncbi:receptor-type tyrosine-protein phosphatase delta-like isoform X2 [Glandiceps talaboti]
MFNYSLVPSDLYTANSNSTSLLTLPDITFSNEGNYTCVLDVDTMATTQVSVGVLPDIANFTCTARNKRIMWCTWDEVDSYLTTEYVFTYKLSYENVWKNCPDDTTKGPNSCYFNSKSHYGGPHNMRVTATNSLGDAKQIKNFYPDIESIPDPPESVQVITRSAYSVKLEWKPPSQWRLPDIYFLKYKLQYYSEWETGNWSEEKPVGTQVFFNLNGLEPYTRYYVRIAAFPENGGHWSSWSSVASGYTAEADPVGRVKFSYIDPQSHDDLRDVTIAWEPLSRRDANGNITAYTVSVKDSNGSQNIFLTNTSMTTYTIKDLQRYRTYEVGVRANNSVGISPLSSILILDEKTAPSPPILTDVNATSDSTISVSWRAPVHPNGIIKSYTLAYLEDDQSWSQITVNSSVYTYVLKGMLSQVQYAFKVQAKNEVGFGDFSNIFRLYIKEGVPDGPPTDLVIKNIKHEPTVLRISWNPPCKEERNGIISLYGIYICQRDEGLQCEEGTSRIENVTVKDPNSHDVSRPEQHDISGLIANTQYAISVCAFTSRGQGPSTEFVLHYTSVGAPEDVPSNLKIPNSSVTDTKVKIIWSPPEQPNTNVTNYRVKATPLNNTEHCHNLTWGSNEMELVMENLCGYETYKITVSACSDAHIPEPCGQDSDPVYASTKIGVPSSPQQVSARSLSSDEVKVSWQLPLRPNGPLSTIKYIVTCFIEEDVKKTRQVTVSNTTETVMNMNCESDEGVQTKCHVSAGNVGNTSNAISADEVLVCYNKQVWLYIGLPLVFLIIIVFLVIGAYISYKSSRKHGAWERVPEASIPKKTPAGVETRDNNDLFETYDDILPEGTSKLDDVNTHSSDHRVDMLNGQHGPTVAVDSKDKDIRKPGHVMIELHAFHEDRQTAVGIVPHDADDYTQVSEVDGQPVSGSGHGGVLPETEIAGTTCQVGDYSKMTEETTPGLGPSRIVNAGRATTHPVTFIPAIQELGQGASDKKPAVLDVPAVHFRGPPVNHCNIVRDLPQATLTNQVNHERDCIDDYTFVSKTSEPVQERRQPETNDILSPTDNTNSTPREVREPENGDIRQVPTVSNGDYITDSAALGENGGIIENDRSHGNIDVDIRDDS